MRTLISGVRIFDGARVVSSADVLVEDDVIGTYDGGRVDDEVDGTGRTLLPGLVDAHTHVFDGSLAQALTFGVTTELDMFCLPGNLVRQRARAEQDDVADLRSAGVVATAPGGHPSQIMTSLPAGLREQLGDAVGDFDTVASPGDAAGFVAARVTDGVDYLKVIVDHGTTAGAEIPALAPETVAALASAGHDAGLLVIAHAASAADAIIALDAGVDGLAHVPFGATPEAAEPVIARCAAQGVFVISTLVYAERLASSTANPAQTAVRQRVDHAIAITRAMHAAGVRLLAGTDANFWEPRHGAGLHRELELLVDAGLSTVDALASATSVVADTFGLADRGRVAPGLRADLLLVDGDPIADITATKKITAVWRRGVRL